MQALEGGKRHPSSPPGPAAAARQASKMVGSRQMNEALLHTWQGIAACSAPLLPVQLGGPGWCTKEEVAPIMPLPSWGGRGAPRGKKNGKWGVLSHLCHFLPTEEGSRANQPPFSQGSPGTRHCSATSSFPSQGGCLLPLTAPRTTLPSRTLGCLGHLPPRAP